MVRRCSLVESLPQNKSQSSPNVKSVANTNLTELLRCTVTCLQSHTSILLPLSSLFLNVLANVSASKTRRRTSRHPQHNILPCLTYASHHIKKSLRDTHTFQWFQLPPQSSQPQSAAFNVFPCHCWKWWKNMRLWHFVAAYFGGNMLGWMAFSPVVTSSWKHWYIMVSRWSLCFPFSTIVMTFSSSTMNWSFDDFILLDTLACSRNVLFVFTSFSPAAFPITNNLDVSITPPGRHVLLDFVRYEVNSHAPDGCSFLCFESEVDIMLVSICKMNQENVITHQKYCFTGVWDFHCQWNMLFHNHGGISRRPMNHCLLSFVERKLFIFNCNFMERLSIIFRPSHPARWRDVLFFVKAPACLVPIKHNHCLTIVLQNVT